VTPAAAREPTGSRDRRHAFELSAIYQPKMIQLLVASGAKYAFIPPIPDISIRAT
jgi:hypothetical protein